MAWSPQSQSLTSPTCKDILYSLTVHKIQKKKHVVKKSQSLAKIWTRPKSLLVCILNFVLYFGNWWRKLILVAHRINFHLSGDAYSRRKYLSMLNQFQQWGHVQHEFKLKMRTHSTWAQNPNELELIVNMRTKKGCCHNYAHSFGVWKVWQCLDELRF